MGRSKASDASLLVAKIKLRAAMDAVEEAQRCLSRASQEISPVVGLVPEWTRLGKLYDQVHAMWYRLERAAGKVKGLDHEPSNEELEHHGVEREGTPANGEEVKQHGQ